MERSDRTGFTLVEISVVLVIIGLIVGGVLVGRDMIRAAEIRKTIGDMEKFLTAMNTFRTKYNAVPGDMRDATTYWPAEGVCPAVANSTPKIETCNGNGDGRVGSPHEPFRFWQHLANAQLIEGLYVGASANGTLEHEHETYGIPWKTEWGVNVPASPLGGGYTAYHISAMPTTIQTDYFFPGAQGRFMIRAGQYHGAWETNVGGVMSPRELYALDLKLDNGVPGTGTIQTLNKDLGPAGWCTGGWNSYYLLGDEPDIPCALVMLRN